MKRNCETCGHKYLSKNCSGCEEPAARGFKNWIPKEDPWADVDETVKLLEKTDGSLFMQAFRMLQKNSDTKAINYVLDNIKEDETGHVRFSEIVRLRREFYTGKND